MKHSFEQLHFSGSCAVDKEGTKTYLDVASFNGQRVYVIMKRGFETKVFDDPIEAEKHYNKIRVDLG